VAKDINEIKFTASLTDASARDYEATPWIRDFIVTAEKKLNCKGPPPRPGTCNRKYILVLHR
jgi:hypothetical protein